LTEKLIARYNVVLLIRSGVNKARNFYREVKTIEGRDFSLNSNPRIACQQNPFRGKTWREYVFQTLGFLILKNCPCIAAIEIL